MSNPAALPMMACGIHLQHKASKHGDQHALPEGRVANIARANRRPGAWLDYQSLYGLAKQYVSGFTPRVNMDAQSCDFFFRTWPDGWLISIGRLTRGPTPGVMPGVLPTKCPNPRPRRRQTLGIHHSERPRSVFTAHGHDTTPLPTPDRQPPRSRFVRLPCAPRTHSSAGPSTVDRAIPCSLPYARSAPP